MWVVALDDEVNFVLINKDNDASIVQLLKSKPLEGIHEFSLCSFVET